MNDTLFTPAPARREIAPGAVHVPSWLTEEQQRWLAARFCEWAAGPVPIRAAMVRGHQMSVKTVCLGWHWVPYRYSRIAEDTDGAPVKPFPDWLARLGRRAVAAAYGEAGAAGYRPDIALINYYDGAARMGMHADREERCQLGGGPSRSDSDGEER